MLVAPSGLARPTLWGLLTLSRPCIEGRYPSFLHGFSSSPLRPQLSTLILYPILQFLTFFIFYFFTCETRKILLLIMFSLDFQPFVCLQNLQMKMKLNNIKLLRGVKCFRNND